MSIHLQTPEYRCKKCNTPFIAYRKDLPCPKCGEIEESDGEGYDFITSQAQAMVYHRNKYGQFTPGAWYHGCHCDNVQMIIFRIFDWRDSDKELNWEETIRKAALIDGDKNIFTNANYMAELFHAIDESLKLKLKKEQERLEEIERKKLINRIKSWFKK